MSERSGHSSTVSGLHERGPLSIGRLLRNLPLLPSYIWPSCSVLLPLLLPASFPISCSPLANLYHFFLDRPSWIPWRIFFFFYFDSSLVFLFSSNRLRSKSSRKNRGYDRIKWQYYQNNAYILNWNLFIISLRSYNIYSVRFFEVD